MGHLLYNFQFIASTAFCISIFIAHCWILKVATLITVVHRIHNYLSRIAAASCSQVFIINVLSLSSKVIFNDVLHSVGLIFMQARLLFRSLIFSFFHMILWIIILFPCNFIIIFLELWFIRFYGLVHFWECWLVLFHLILMLIQAILLILHFKL